MIRCSALIAVPHTQNNHYSRNKPQYSEVMELVIVHFLVVVVGWYQRIEIWLSCLGM